MAEETTPEPGSEETKVPLEDVKARLAGKEPEPEKKTDEEKQPEADKEPEKDDELERIVAQADKPDAVRNALTAERNAAREARERADAAEARVQEYVDRDKTEAQKREEKATKDRQRADAAEAKLLRVEVAISTKLPLELAERLQGSNKRELEADAARLLELVKPDAPSGDPDAGKGRGDGREESFSDTLRKKAGVTAT